MTSSGSHQTLASPHIYWDCGFPLPAGASQPEPALHSLTQVRSQASTWTRGHLQTIRGNAAAVTNNKQFSGAVGSWRVNAPSVLQACMHCITHFVIKLGNVSENFKKYNVGIADTAITIVDTASYLVLDYWYSPTLITRQKLCPQVDLILKGINFLMKKTYST